MNDIKGSLSIGSRVIVIIPSAIQKPKPESHVYVANMKFISCGYFTVFDQVHNDLYMRLHSMGYTIPDRGADGHRIRPHKSIGVGFQNYLKTNHSDKCDHYRKGKFIDDDEEDSFGYGHYQYANDLKAIYSRYYEQIWLRTIAKKYFKKRDPKVVEYLPMILSETNHHNVSVIPIEQLAAKQDLEKRAYEIIKAAFAAQHKSPVTNEAKEFGSR